MTRTINFSSINEAVNQGFVVAACKEYQSYKGCSIYGHDNSQRGFIGATSQRCSNRFARSLPPAWQSFR